MAERVLDRESVLERTDLAAFFREVAAALETGERETIDVDGADVSVAFPPQASLSVVAERGDDPPTSQLEVALEWDEPADEGSVDLESADADIGEDVGDEDADERTAPEADDGETSRGVEASATAAIPPYAVRSDPESGPATDRGGRRSRFEVYRDRAGEWRWRLVHWNGEILADSGEGYASRYNAVRAVRSVKRAVPDARVDHLE